MSDQVLRENKADEAYALIKEKIIDFEYMPGMAVTELDLCKQLNMSRTPVRIALARLTAEGFITEIGPKKNMIADVSVDSFIDVYRIREALDLLSVRTACYTWHNKSEIDGLRRMIEEQKELTSKAQVDSRAFLKMDKEYHKAIVAMTRNKLLCKEIAYIYDLYWRYDFYSIHVSGYRTTVTEHERIADAIERRDATQCVEQTKQHLETVKEFILVGIAKGFTPLNMNNAKIGYVLR